MANDRRDMVDEADRGRLHDAIGPPKNGSSAQRAFEWGERQTILGGLKIEEMWPGSGRASSSGQRSRNRFKSADASAKMAAVLTVGGAGRKSGAGVSGGPSCRWQLGPLQG